MELTNTGFENNGQVVSTSTVCLDNRARRVHAAIFPDLGNDVMFCHQIKYLNNNGKVVVRGTKWRKDLDNRIFGKELQQKLIEEVAKMKGGDSNEED